LTSARRVINRQIAHRPFRPCHRQTGSLGCWKPPRTIFPVHPPHKIRTGVSAAFCWPVNWKWLRPSFCIRARLQSCREKSPRSALLGSVATTCQSGARCRDRPPAFRSRVEPSLGKQGCRAIKPPIGVKKKAQACYARRTPRSLLSQKTVKPRTSSPK
jgi:hypothetical protein